MKTACLYYSNLRPLDAEPLIVINDFGLSFVTKRKYSGLILYSNFSWLPYFNDICLKLSSQLFVLSRFTKIQTCF